MTTRGSGAVAIWHDIADEGRDEFYAWHGRQHMPERAAIPGFRRGRRFIAIDADREFFNLYDTDNADVVRGDAYHERLNNPTPWTLATVGHFRAVARSLCEVAWAECAADGGLVATIRYSVAPEDTAAHLERAEKAVLPGLAGAPGIAGVQLLIADLAASGVVNAEQRARGASNEVPSHILVVEGWADDAPFIATVRETIGRDFPATLASESRIGFYRHQVTVLPET
jgi:hypothetical protein